MSANKFIMEEHTTTDWLMIIIIVSTSSLSLCYFIIIIICWLLIIITSHWSNVFISCTLVVYPFGAFVLEILHDKSQLFNVMLLISWYFSQLVSVCNLERSVPYSWKSNCKRETTLYLVNFIRKSKNSNKVSEILYENCIFVSPKL